MPLLINELTWSWRLRPFSTTRNILLREWCLICSGSCQRSYLLISRYQRFIYFLGNWFIRMESILLFFSLIYDLILRSPSLLLVQNLLDSNLIEPVPFVIRSCYFWRSVCPLSFGSTFTSSFLHHSTRVDARLFYSRWVLGKWRDVRFIFKSL